MAANNRSRAERFSENGISIVVIAVAMIFVVGMAGLAIDLASLYVARNQAQRAADAAALAGAQAFIQDGCATGSTGSGLTAGCMLLAKQRAQTVGDQNLIAGVNPGIKLEDISFPNQTSSDPQITVVAGRGTYDGIDHGNAIETFFVKIFGITTASVSASATAEAYNPSGESTNTGTTCLKPWLFPNCDQFNPDTNPDCSGGGYFVKPDGNGGFYVARPVNFPTGAIGEPYVIKPASPSAAAAPGQYYAAYIPSATSVPTECPGCVNVPGGGGSGSQSAAIYRENISCCNTNPVVCGQSLTLQTTLQSSAGNMAGPTAQGVDCLIHQDELVSGSNGANCGQDFVQGLTNNCTDPTGGLASNMPMLPAIPPIIMPGANNPYSPGGTQPIDYASSNSVIVCPIYNGVIASGQNTVQVAGFVQLFIRSVDTSGNPQGTTYAYVLGISGCGSGGSGSSGSGGSGAILASGGSAIPVRLIHQ